jgi:RNA polymerase sigma-70 factor (ECF subfamily)
MPPLMEAPLPALGDGELLPRLRAGDAEAFAVLMRRNNRRLYRLARGILQDEGEAEEAVQEGYIRALTHLDGFKGQASLATWLARIVTNEALGRLRRHRPSIGIEDLENSSAADSPLDGAAAAAATPEHAAARQEIRRAIESAIDALPAPFRLVFVLRAIEQLSTSETASSLGIPEETVKTRLYRANKLLREALSGEFAAIWDDPFPFAGERCDLMVARVIARIRGAAASAERGSA